jgi:hypothetical protein
MLEIELLAKLPSRFHLLTISQSNSEQIVKGWYHVLQSCMQ